MSFNNQYDKTVAKGLCFNCGERKAKRTWCEKAKIWAESLWCEFCAELPRCDIDLTEEIPAA